MLQMLQSKVLLGSILDWSLMMPVQKTCEHCAISFSTPHRRSETVKFCSIECKTSAKRVTLSCAACGVSFERKKHLAESKYCSRACYHSATKGVAQAPRGEQYHRTCEVCATSFRVTFTRRDTARWCSRVCQSNSPAYRLEASEAQRGEKSWRWAGGLHQGKRGYVRMRGLSRASGSYGFEHRIVIERAMQAAEPNHPFLVEMDGGTRLDPKIDVHHIDRNRSNNALSNLLAVTKRAHGQIHHKNLKPNPWECWPYSNLANLTFY